MRVQAEMAAAVGIGAISVVAVAATAAADGAATMRRAVTVLTAVAELAQA